MTATAKKAAVPDWQVIVGDCRETMAAMPAESVDAIVTDPPYGLGFMGKGWDAGVPGVEFWRGALRVAKPGAHLLAFGGSRTWHRMAVAIEDAGWEIRDSIQWLYGSGFPKSLDVAKAVDASERGGMVREKLLHFARERGIDGRWLEAHGVASAASFADWTVGGHVPSQKNWMLVKAALGVTADEEAAFERAVIGIREGVRDTQHSRPACAISAQGHERTQRHDLAITAPATDAAREWQGWGTALKPAHEPIVVARKPLAGTVAHNVLTYGTGALNIDACRIASGDDHREKCESVVGLDSNRNGNCYGKWTGERESSWHPSARWPANVILDPEAAAMLDAQTGALTSAAHGNPSRFFYVAKPTRTERDLGLAGPARTGGELTNRKDGSAGLNNPRAGAGRTSGGRNIHPTVKPVDLMRYLVRLVTPPGGLVLDPFCGSGTTGGAAVLERARFIGCELSDEYAEIARARIRAWAESDEARQGSLL